MESVTETRFLALFGCEGLDWFEVEVVVEMQVVKVLAVNQQHQHVETLTADLKTNLHPVHLCKLEELSAGECFEQASLLLSHRLLLVQLVKNP